MMKARTNYHGLVVAGLGAVGRSLFVIGDHCLDSFAEILVIDRGPAPPADPLPPRARFISGDISRSDWLADRLAAFGGMPVLFINLCAGVDNVKIRRLLARHDIAYLDSCCCAPEGSHEARFSRMMPYTKTRVRNNRPQWLCWGINPGLVELMVRKLMARFAPHEGDFSVTIYEHDQLEGRNGAIVSWCPEALIEEIMQSPTLECGAGRLVEETVPGARKVVACWAGQPVASRIVGHEDIWNIGLLPSVRQARFIYGLHPRVMEIFERDIDQARRLLTMAEPGAPVFGVERIAVAVRSGLSDRELTMIWQEDHHDIWRRYGINAVQYQTGKAILLALRLLQFTRFGLLAGQYCAADLPLNPADWQQLDMFMRELGINWRDASDFAPRLCSHSDPASCGSFSSCAMIGE
jgi:hypothetical protein